MVKRVSSQQKTIKSRDGIAIFYDIDVVENKDAFLFFVHGLGGDSTAWDNERTKLNDHGYATVAIDLRGHGKSDRPADEKSYEMDFFAQDILGIIKKENIKKTVLVGHCFGGMVTLTLEGKYPKTAESLILVDTSYKPPYIGSTLAHHVLLNKIVSIIFEHAPNIHIAGHADFSKFVGTSDYDARRILSDVLHTSLRSYLLSCERLLEFDATTLLNKIQIPTLVVDGTKDSIFPPKVAEDLSHRIKRSEIEFIEGANHVLVINNPDDLVVVMHKFLKKTGYSASDM